jgi:hypothetical protein
MSNRHHVIQPKAWLTEAGWRQLEPMLDAMPADGGCVTIVIDARPDIRNFLTASVATFTKKQREAVRKAVIKARQQNAGDQS